MLHLLSTDDNIRVCDGIHTFSITFMQRYLTAAYDFMESFIVFCYFTSGRNCRGTEQSAHLLINNQEWHRGTFWALRQLVLIPNHDKTMYRRARSADATRFVDPISSCFVALPFLVLVRHACIFFASSLKLSDSVANSFWDYPFVHRNGTPYLEGTFGTVVAKFTRDVLKATFTVSHWRQIYVNFFTKFLTTDDSEEVSLLGSNQSSHSLSMEQRHYNLDGHGHPTLELTKWNQHRRDSDKLHYKFFNLWLHWMEVLRRRYPEKHELQHEVLHALSAPAAPSTTTNRKRKMPDTSSSSSSSLPLPLIEPSKDSHFHHFSLFKNDVVESLAYTNHNIAQGFLQVLMQQEGTQHMIAASSVISTTDGTSFIKGSSSSQVTGDTSTTVGSLPTALSTFGPFSSVSNTDPDHYPLTLQKMDSMVRLLQKLVCNVLM